MTEHTPGPWEWLNLGFGFELIGNNGRPVIDCDCSIEAPGDFTLLAAAPDLLAACEAEEAVEPLRRAVWDAEKAFDRLPQYAPKEEQDKAVKRWTDAHNAFIDQLNLIDRLRPAAIRKARGEVAP